MKEYHANTVGKNAFALVLANDFFRHLWFGQICSQLAVSIMLFVLALRVYQVTASNAAVSALFLTYGIPSVLFGMGAGAVVDHLDKRRVLILCDLLRAGTVLGFMFQPANLVYIYMLSTLNSLITQFYIPSQAPTIPRFIKGPYLVTANSLFSFTFYTSLAMGSVVAGPLLRGFGIYGIFIFISALFLTASYHAARLPKQRNLPDSILHMHIPALRHVYDRVISDMKEGIAFIVGSPQLRDALVLLTGTQIVLMILGTLGPGFADRMLEIDVHDASLLILGPVVMGIIGGALWVGWAGTKLSPRALIEKGVVGAGVILILIALTVRLKSIAGLYWLSKPWIIMPLEFFFFVSLGVANSMLDVPASSILQKETTERMRGRIYGILTSAIGGVGIVPVILGGVLADMLGVGKVIFFLGVSIVVYGIYRKWAGAVLVNHQRMSGK